MSGLSGLKLAEEPAISPRGREDSFSDESGVRNTVLARDHALGRSAIGYAFESERGVVNPQHVTRINQSSRESLLNADGEFSRAVATVRDECRSEIDRLRVVLPVYDQEANIGRTIDYFTSTMGMDPSHVLAVSISKDNSDGIIRTKGVEFFRQEDLLHSYLKDKDKFLELLKANNTGEVRGKGLTMFAAYLHRFMTGEANPHELVMQVDTDIDNIGAGEQEWDPATYFALALHHFPELQTIKAAKNGRNNQPIHVLLNSLSVLGGEAQNYQKQIGIERWPLTGEYGWTGDVSSRLRWATGYAIEMVLNMGQVDMGLRRKQVEIPLPRRDGHNYLKKETVMYSDIGRVMLNVGKSGKKLNELTLADIAHINASVRGHVMLVADELDSNPGPRANPNEVHLVQPSRIIPDFHTLVDEGIIYRP